MTGLLLSGHFWCLQAYGKVGHLVIHIIKVQSVSCARSVKEYFQLLYISDFMVDCLTLEE